MALYKLSTSPMAGVGVLARTMLPQRAAIMSEKPLLECLTLGSDALVWSQMSDWIRRVGLMNAADEEALLRLDDETKSSLPPLTSRSLDRIGEDTRVLQRVRATFFQHAFPFAPPKATAPIMLRLFNHICYLNHSCDPNAVVNWHVETGEMEVRATRIIDAGEEVCVAYIDTLQGRAARWQALGFNCVCSSCNLSEERDHIVADLARSRLNEQVALLSAFKSRHFISVSDAPFVELADIPAILSDPQASDVLRHSSTVVDELCSVALCHPAILLGHEMRYVMLAAMLTRGDPHSQDQALEVFKRKLQEGTHVTLLYGPFHPRCRQAIFQVHQLLNQADEHQAARVAAWGAHNG